MGKEASVQLRVTNRQVQCPTPDKTLSGIAIIMRFSPKIRVPAYRRPTVFISWTENEPGSFKWSKLVLALSGSICALILAMGEYQRKFLISSGHPAVTPS
jgi:hypothetical protein